MTTRDRLIIVVVLMAAALGGFWFVGLAPKRKEAADLQGQIVTAQQKLSDAEQMAVQARKAKASYDDDYAAVATLGKAVPKSDALASLLYQLQSAAHDARIDFSSLKLSPAGAAGPTVAATPAANAATTNNGNPGGSAAPAAAGSTATATQAAAATLPPGASVGEAGFPTMPFSFVFTGTYFDMESFLHDVQGFVRVRGQKIDVVGRLLSVDAFSLTAGPGGFPNVKASVSATAYVQSPNDATSTTTPGAATTGVTTSPATTPTKPATASEVAK
jgi:Tfp pilus assembly protein PilO